MLQRLQVHHGRLDTDHLWLVDSAAGTVTRGYDGLNRLTNESTPQGSLGYSFDSAGRRTSMAVAGQPAVSYAYDNADRLTGITQGSASVNFSYDNARRRSTLTLANGIALSYSYDNANRLAGISYAQGTTTLGNLSYSYDANGRRTAIGGSYAQSDLPAAISTTTYNAANQLTKWGSATLSYDANGNLLSDGSLTHGWNARNQLASLSGGAVASFQYDALGRRIGKTVAGSATGFLHDGINPVQELTGSTPKANLLTGLGVDETFSRTDASGARHLLTDALGSTLALTDGAGAVQTSYSYEPYGKTTVSGTASSNSFEYTGRENDSTGLYFYRARYYNPGLQRFVSEDPIGLAGGINTYSYVEGNPVSRTDPTGLDWIYSQSTGGLSRIDGGVSNPVATGYAGNGSNLNNPAGQSQPNSGPVPQGDYSIGPQRNSPNTGRGIMDLIPSSTNNMFGRSAFQIHGDNSRGDRSASNGCMILPRNIRDLIGGSGDNRLTVVP